MFYTLLQLASVLPCERETPDVFPYARDLTLLSGTAV